MARTNAAGGVSPGGARGIEDRFLEIEANEVHGFGGIYADAKSDIVAIVTDLAQSSRAQAA